MIIDLSEKLKFTSRLSWLITWPWSRDQFDGRHFCVVNESLFFAWSSMVESESVLGSTGRQAVAQAETCWENKYQTALNLIQQLTSKIGDLFRQSYVVENVFKVTSISQAHGAVLKLELTWNSSEKRMVNILLKMLQRRRGPYPDASLKH